MRRIDRLGMCVRHEAMMAALFFTAALAAGVWAVVAAVSEDVPGGAALILAATIALCLGMLHLRECLRVSRLAMREMELEERR